MAVLSFLIRPFPSIAVVIALIPPMSCLAQSQTLPKALSDGRVLVLDDFGHDLGAWALEGAAVGAVRIIKDELSGHRALEWNLGDVEGKLAYRHLKGVADLGRYNRMILRVRAWDDEGRVGVGCAARCAAELSGYPKHKVDRVPSWGLYDRRPDPSDKWRELDLRMDFPEWYPWGERDNRQPGFWITASAGFSKKASLRLGAVRLIDDAVEVEGDWGRLTSSRTGDAHWDYQVRLTNRTDDTQKVGGSIGEPRLRRFAAALLDRICVLKPQETGVLRVRVTMPRGVVEDAPALYHEDLYVRITPEAAPETATTVRLPATVPLRPFARPCLLDTSKEWQRQREDLAGLDAKQQTRELRTANEWLDREIVLPKPYHLNREAKLVDGTVLKLPQIVGWGLRCPKCKTLIRKFPTPSAAVCPKCDWQDLDSDPARSYWHQQHFKAVEALGRAYQLTLDRRYAGKAAEILRAYAAHLDDYPLRAMTTAREKGWARFAINNLHEAWGIMPLCYGYDMICDVPGLFTPEDREALHHRFLIPVARSLVPITSWFSNQTSVRYMAAALCGINAGDSNLAHFAVFGHAGLQRSIEASINPDGFMTEIPLNYHWANLIEMLRLAIILKNTGIDAPYRRDLLKKACEVPYRRAFPDGSVPGFGPHGRGLGPGYYRQHYQTVAKVFDDPVFKQLADKDEGLKVINGLKSVHFPNSELIVLRDGQHALSFLFGNKRRCHDGALAFTWHGLGEVLAPAVGSLYNITHKPDAWISPFYCQVNVDDLHQIDSTGKLTFHQFDPKAQIASAQANELFPGVKVERTLALYDGLLYIADRFESEQEHTYQWAYLSHGALTVSTNSAGDPVEYRRDKMALSGKRTDDTWQAEWSRKNLKLRLTMLGAPNTEVLSGDSYISPGGPRDKTPIVLARRRAKSAVFMAMLEPYRAVSRVLSVRSEKLGKLRAAAVRVRTAGGQSVFVVNYGDGAIRGPEWECEQRAAILSWPKGEDG